MNHLRSLAAAFLLPTLSGCMATLGPVTGSNGGQPLDSVHLIQPQVEIEFLDTGEIYQSDESFPPPKTIDCSRLRMESGAFEDAIDAGASVVRIHTKETVKTLTTPRPDQEPIVERVSIKPYYGGVLALCNMSDRGKGPDSRSYRIRGLDEYFIKGRDGLISVVGAVVDLEPGRPSAFSELILKTPQTPQRTTQYSWMLWLTDRSTIFTERAGT